MFRRLSMGHALFHLDEDHLGPVAGNQVNLAACAPPAPGRNDPAAAHIEIFHNTFRSNTRSLRHLPRLRRPCVMARHCPAMIPPYCSAASCKAR